jgi:hypothetical protein
MVRHVSNAFFQIAERTMQFLFRLGKSWPARFALVAAFSLPAHAAKAPADPCSLLPAAEVSKVLGREFTAPQSNVAPRPYKNTAQGTDCTYRSSSGRGSLLFRIYFDSSPSEATELFGKLKMFYGTPTRVSGVGDETYIDSKHGLHERKGNVRFYLELNGVDTSPATKDKPLVNLANAVGGHL